MTILSFEYFLIPACLYGKDMVNLVGGGQRAIENLKTGDRIWSLSHDGITLFEDEVILMMDNGPNKTSDFLSSIFANCFLFDVSLFSSYVLHIQS